MVTVAARSQQQRRNGTAMIQVNRILLERRGESWEAKLALSWRFWEGSVDKEAFMLVCEEWLEFSCI